MCIITNVYKPEITSSSTMPNPPLSFSACLAGKGLIISNNLQTTNVTITYQNSLGINNNAIHIPTTSSITHCLGSFPYIFSNFELIGRLTTRVILRAQICTIGISNPGIKYIARATRLPKVPGANGTYPE